MPDLELTLRELGRELEWPPEPPLAGAVAARLLEPRRRRLGRPLALALAAVLAALAVALAVPPARSAILDFLRIGNVEIRQVQTLPPLRVERAAPGPRVPLAEALNSVSFDALVPHGYSSVHVESDVITFVWPDRLLMELAGDVLVLKSVVASGTPVEELNLDGLPAVWIEGAPHGVYLPGGEHRLAGNVLIWVDRGVTFRLEGLLTRSRAVALARALTAGRR